MSLNLTIPPTFATSLRTGQTLKVDAFIRELPALQQAFEESAPQADASSLILRLSAPPELPAAEQFQDSGQLPPIPQPSGPNSSLPATSQVIQVAASPDEDLFVLVQDGDIRGYYPISGDAFGFSVSPRPAFPSDIQLIYNRFWRNLGSFHLRGPQTFTKEITSTMGVSETEQMTIAAELGVSVKGLSAKLSESFQTSFTVTNLTTETERYTLEIPADKIAVYTIWQLVDELRLIDGDGALVEWSGALILDTPIVEVALRATWQRVEAREGTTTFASDPVFFDA